MEKNTDAKLIDELKKMQEEPILPAEMMLIKWSLGIGLGGLVFLYFLSQWLFPGGH